MTQQDWHAHDLAQAVADRTGVPAITQLQWCVICQGQIEAEDCDTAIMLSICAVESEQEAQHLITQALARRGEFAEFARDGRICRVCLMTLPCELDFAQGQQLQTLARQVSREGDRNDPT